MTRALAPIKEDVAKLNETTTKLATDVNTLTNKVNTLTDKVNTLTDKVTELDNRVQATQLANAQIRRIAAVVESHSFFYWLFTDQAQTWNRSRGSGREARLEVVPFESGDDPTTAPVCVHHTFLPEAWLKCFPQHNLPPLSTVRAVQNLAAAPRDLYFQGYYPEAPLPPAADRIPRILTALGVMG